MADQTADCMVHESPSLVAEFSSVLVRLHRRAENERALALIGNVAEVLIHAVAQHHAARGIGGFSPLSAAPLERWWKKMYSAARPPSSTAMRSQLFLRHQEAIFGRPLDGVAERADDERNNRDFVNRVLPGQRHGDDGMAEPHNRRWARVPSGSAAGSSSPNRRRCV